MFAYVNMHISYI